MIVASYGGGVNSTAMLIGCAEGGLKVDLVLFADTGGEKPHTYEHNARFSEWLVAHGLPEITVVRKEGITLEQDCLNRKALPSIAYGFKSCSDHFKFRPQKAYLAANGLKPDLMLVGFDAGEERRARRGMEITDPWAKGYPLIEWGWGRDECEEAIARAGVSHPGKSACFFCPSSKKIEIFQLRRTYPELAARAVAMENNAETTAVVGLGRSFAWRDLYEAKDRQVDMFPESPVEEECMCYDGELPPTGDVERNP